MAALSKIAGLLAVAAVIDAVPFTPTRAGTPSAAVLRRQDVTPLPDYATAYAPVFYLNSGESYWPSNIVTHLENVIPEIDFTPVDGFQTAGQTTLANLLTVNASAYLTSIDNVDDSPAWQLSRYGKPTTTDGGYSAAPGTIIAVQKNATWVDVFYFTFFSFNRGGAILGFPFGDHVGDWEHTMIRFIDGQPTGMYFSQHGSGSAYTWSALNKTDAGRPRAFIAIGGHANYVKAGEQEYTTVGKLLTDKTDAGFAWDVAQNYRGYWFDNATQTFAPAGGATADDASWLRWTGFWGDDKYPLYRRGQYCIANECHYGAGPTGPLKKNLGRHALCQRETGCSVFTSPDDLTHQSKRTPTVEGGYPYEYQGRTIMST